MLAKIGYVGGYNLVPVSQIISFTSERLCLCRSDDKKGC